MDEIVANSNPTISTASQTTPVKTSSEAVSASEGTRLEPNKTAKPVKTDIKKVKKQNNSPEEVPSKWDKSNVSSKSKNRKSAATVVRKPAKSASRPKSSTSNGPISPPATVTAAVLSAKKKSTIPAKSNNLLPITDPFESNKKALKLIDKDLISHLSFKKVGREPLAKTVNNAAMTLSKQAPSAKKSAVQIGPVSEAAETLLNGPKTFNKPVNKLTQNKLDNYFVPQGQTV
ncbi:hypothetical protein PGTUg99_030397 [Puccinia graminis f. sp. tritici]|uniref:Uncharacterized protein n=1 Tax=Puccinia graminis f. sp. tritici TaxID=56615 RepID=A0A5B0RIA8_PUCGR|nr:hypothetical protein PGTUg99_030397 [Puccinia graminis f. sp. tritici]